MSCLSFTKIRVWSWRSSPWNAMPNRISESDSTNCVCVRLVPEQPRLGWALSEKKKIGLGQARNRLRFRSKRTRRAGAGRRIIMSRSVCLISATSSVKAWSRQLINNDRETFLAAISKYETDKFTHSLAAMAGTLHVCLAFFWHTAWPNRCHFCAWCGGTSCLKLDWISAWK